MNDEGGGMVLGNCARCAGSLWQSKRRGEPVFCDPCQEIVVGEQEKPDEELGATVQYAHDESAGKVMRKITKPKKVPA